MCLHSSEKKAVQPWIDWQVAEKWQKWGERHPLQSAADATCIKWLYGWASPGSPETPDQPTPSPKNLFPPAEWTQPDCWLMHALFAWKIIKPITCLILQKTALQGLPIVIAGFPPSSLWRLQSLFQPMNLSEFSAIAFKVLCCRLFMAYLWACFGDLF